MVAWNAGIREYWSGGVLEGWNKNLFLERILTVRFYLLPYLHVD
jgi:hypothetical protein